MERSPRVSLVSKESGPIRWLTDEDALGRGTVVAFTERTGGVSKPPFASLNLAAHVADEPAAVDENRTRLLGALGMSELRARLTMSEQVHGERIVRVGAADAGAGAWAGTAPAPVAGTDALLTTEPDVPLLLCFADCVPVILEAPGGVAVAHSGWRGALAGIAGKTARALGDAAGVSTGELRAWVGPHIGACHYEVDADLLSHFCNTFGTFARVDSGGLDLQAVVTASLIDAGVPSCSIASSGVCTAETTDRFYSYRAEDGITGRHGALACLRSS